MCLLKDLAPLRHITDIRWINSSNINETAAQRASCQDGTNLSSIWSPWSSPLPAPCLPVCVCVPSAYSTIDSPSDKSVQ